jgi:serine/threonine protein kinase
MGTLGKGGFGVVYHVINKLDGGEYALKRIKLPTKKFAREKVMREVHALAQLEHPAIVRYFSSWVEQAPPGWAQRKEWKSSGHTIETPPTLSHHNKQNGNVAVESLLNSDSHNSSFTIEFREEISKTNNLTQNMSSHEFETKSQSLATSNEPTTTDDLRHYNTSESPQYFLSSPPSFLFIQMQLCQKQSLKDWLRINIHNRERTEILKQFEEILDAVVYVHKKGLMHRDLKVN